MRQRLGSTREFVKLALDQFWLSEPEWFQHHGYHYWELNAKKLSLSRSRQIILILEERAKRINQDRVGEVVPGDAVDPRYPVYSEVVEVFPVFRHGLSLERKKAVVQPSEIPNLLYLLRIPSHPDGLDVENHGFGYHFHYGRIKRDKLERTNLLLTFDPKTKMPKSRKFETSPHPLYSEYHADGKTTAIDAEAIGENRKYPIYLVCLAAGEKRGLSNFKHPSREATVFYGWRKDAV